MKVIRMSMPFIVILCLKYWICMIVDVASAFLSI